MNDAVTISNLSFSYTERMNPVIKDVSLTIPAGSRFGIFGPNGAGKTTLMSLMAGLIHYASGSIKLLGNEVKRGKHYINTIMGFVPQDFSFYEELSPVENMQFFGAWYGLSPTAIKKTTDDLLETMGLNHARHKPLKQFSGGMKRRINLAIGVMNQPKILFLDEPTVGVDVQSRNAIINFLKTINKAGTTLIYTSHQLKEAEDLCTEIALIDEGNIIIQGALSALLSQYRHHDLEGLFLQLTGRAYRD